MKDSWQSLGDVTSKITDRLTPVTFTVRLRWSVADALFAHCDRTGVPAETVIAEIVSENFEAAA